jgi:hypothetical protein
MALPDLTGQNIQDTYQRVLQTDGGDLRDGTGSLVTLTNITASGNISASGIIQGGGLSIDGPSNSHIEVGEYPVGYDFLELPGSGTVITGSGLIISGAMADANHHNMLKIGNVELIDLNTSVSTNEPIFRALNSTTSTYLAGFDANPNASATQNMRSIAMSNIYPLLGGAVTASAVSASGTITATSFVGEIHGGSF